MADDESGGVGRSILGLLLLVAAVLIAFWLWRQLEGSPDLGRPMVADLTGHDQGDAARPYPIRVFVNPDQSGAIAMNYRNAEHARRFGYAVRQEAEEQVSITFQAQLYGTDQLPPGEPYFLTLNKGGGAVLVWHDRSAQGQWQFGD